MLTTPTPHIGMPVWVFDVNHREYERDANGKSIGGPIWRKHWRAPCSSSAKPSFHG